jgi:hypothetical protein
MTARTGTTPDGPAPEDLRWTVALVRRGKPFAMVAANRAISGRNRSRTDPTAGRFTRRDTTNLVCAAFDRFELKTPTLPPGEPTRGSRQNVVLAAFTLVLLEALEDAGVERSYAIELVGDVRWRFYRQWGRVTQTATRFVSTDPTRRRSNEAGNGSLGFRRIAYDTRTQFTTGRK